MRKEKFVGRATELARLRSLQGKKVASFVVAKGRRRVGKSRLMDEFSKNFDHYYKFEGLPPEEGVTQQHQLEEFCTQISQQFKTAKAIYQDWSDAFWAVGERVRKGKVLLFFDEISWMGHQCPTFLGKLKIFWDNLLSKNDKLIFVACSSASSWLQKNLLSSTGFVGRVSFNLTVEALPLYDCNQFWAEKISAYEKLKVLSVTGGIPKYLEEIDPKYSAEENIKRLCFSPGGILINDFDRIFSDLFLRESQFYEKIVTALSTGAKESTEIQKLLNDDDSQRHGRLSEYLWELEEAGFVSRDYTWSIRTGADSKLSQYRLQDNYLRFYLKYIKPNLAKIRRGIFNFKNLSLLSSWNAIMGLQFENLVLSNRQSIHGLLGIEPDTIVNSNPFFQRKNKRYAGCQIDYMIQTRFNSLYICEMKFSSQPVDLSVIKQVEEKIARLHYPKGFSCRPVLIHVNGVTDEVLEADYFSHIIDLGELMQGLTYFKK